MQAAVRAPAQRSSGDLSGCPAAVELAEPSASAPLTRAATGYPQTPDRCWGGSYLLQLPGVSAGPGINAVRSGPGGACGWHTERVGLQAQLWRGIAAFRFASLAYAAVLLVVDRADYQRLVLAWVVLAGMTGWTVATSYAYAVPARRTRALLTADVAVTAAALLSTLAVQRPGEGSVMPVTATWAAGVSQAICGRIRDLGGSADIMSGPGTGTEVVLRIPRLLDVPSPRPMT